MTPTPTAARGLNGPVLGGSWTGDDMVLLPDETRCCSSSSRRTSPRATQAQGPGNAPVCAAKAEPRCHLQEGPRDDHIYYRLMISFGFCLLVTCLLPPESEGRRPPCLGQGPAGRGRPWAVPRRACVCPGRLTGRPSPVAVSSVSCFITDVAAWTF